MYLDILYAISPVESLARAILEAPYGGSSYDLSRLNSEEFGEEVYIRGRYVMLLKAQMSRKTNDEGVDLLEYRFF